MTFYEPYQWGYYTLPSTSSTKSSTADSSNVNSPPAHQSPADHQNQNMECFSSPLQSDSQPQWAILKPPDVSDFEINQLRQRVKYVAVLNHIGAAIVLVDQGYGNFKPQNAYWISYNLIFVFNEEDTGVFGVLAPRGMMLYKNPVMMFTSAVDLESAVEFSTAELATFLFTLGEHPLMKIILEWDTCYTVADRYILAMAFLYLKKANMPFSSSGDVVYLLAAILLAHKLEEDDSYRKRLLIVVRQALSEQSSEFEIEQFLQSIQSFETYIFVMMDYRAFVTAEECESIIAAAPFHPLWKRRRLDFHAGAVRSSHQQWKEDYISESYFNFGFFLESEAPCVVCQANAMYFDLPRHRNWQEENFQRIKSHLANLCNIVQLAHISKVRMSYQYGCDQLKELLSGLNYDYRSSKMLMQGAECLPSGYIEVLALERQLEYMLSMEKFVQQCIMAVRMQKSANNHCYAQKECNLTRLV